jgi:hypothetical protein
MTTRDAFGLDAGAVIEPDLHRSLTMDNLERALAQVLPLVLLKALEVTLA